MEIPLCDTHIESQYYHIGEGKLRMLIDEHPNEGFYVMNGNRRLSENLTLSGSGTAVYWLMRYRRRNIANYTEGGSFKERFWEKRRDNKNRILREGDTT